MIVFNIMKYLGQDSELQSIFNTHFGFLSGDAGFWEDYATSPIFPVNEEPESDDFYLTYNFRDSYDFETWWNLTSDIRLTIHSNNIKLMEDFTKRFRDIFKDYEFAAERINLWLGQQNLNTHVLNWSAYHSGGIISAPEQENGIHERNIRILVNSKEC